FWLGRGVFDALAQLTAGFARFGRSDFTEPIHVAGRDELSHLAEQANRMADNLRRLGEERARTDWLKAGHAGLANELRGELEPKDVAARAARSVARHVDAPAAALYYADNAGLRLLGHYALSTDGKDGNLRASFRVGEGLVGQAAEDQRITVVKDPPAGYLQVRSGLGEAA